MNRTSPHLHRVRKGLRLPIAGAPDQSTIDDRRDVHRVAVVAGDFIGLSPRMRVKEGERVARGQVLFEDRKRPGVLHTAPAAGTVEAINRGARRSLQTVVIAVADDEDDHPFTAWQDQPVESYDADALRALLIESGCWTALRTRPYSRQPPVDSTPRSIFVTATDTNPLAPAPERVLAGHDDDLTRGLHALSILAPVHLCTAPGSPLAACAEDLERVTVHRFKGKHPAGTVGLHIHRIDPVDRTRTVWHCPAREAAAIGHLLRTGTLDVERTIALAGPKVARPRLLRTRLGADVRALCADELSDPAARIIAGSVFNGHACDHHELAFLGRYHSQITALAPVGERVFMGWLSSGTDLFSVWPTYLSKLIPGKRFSFSSTLHGSVRAIIPSGVYERLLPFDILPTFLLRALQAADLERAEQLGALELDEEDLALCTFACLSKLEHGVALREVLTRIEKEG